MKIQVYLTLYYATLRNYQLQTTELNKEKPAS